MAKTLPIWVFLSVSLVLIGTALLPLVRVLLGIDVEIALPFTTTVMLLIGGLMSGLSAMILLVRRAPVLPIEERDMTHSNHRLVWLHASGFLLFTGMPLLNFLVAYWMWVRWRHHEPALNFVGREVLNFQVTIYLYLLLSLFLVFAGLGFFTTPLILLFHGCVTVIAVTNGLLGKSFTYPANIPIVEGRR